MAILESSPITGITSTPNSGDTHGICRGTDKKLYLVYVDFLTGNVEVMNSADEGITWSAFDTALTKTASESYQLPNIICDKNGILHVIVFDNSGTRKIVEVYKHFNDSNWSSIITIQSSVSNQTAVNIAAGNDEIWCGIANTFVSITIYKSSTPGIWSLQTTMSSTNNDIDMAVDSQGRCHVLWTKDSPDAAGMKYANSFDGPWQQKTLFFGFGLNNAGSTDPRMTITSDDRIHCVYPSGSASSAAGIYFNMNPDLFIGDPFPTGITPKKIYDGGGATTTNDVINIASDKQDKIYIYESDGNLGDEFSYWESTNFINFSQIIGTVTNRFRENRGSISSLWPQVTVDSTTRYINLPSSGFLTYNYSSIDSSISTIKLDTTSFDTLFNNSQSSLSGFINAIGFPTSDIGGFADVQVEKANISGITPAVGFSYSESLIHTNDIIYNSSTAQHPRSKNICRRIDGKLFCTYISRTNVPSTSGNVYVVESDDDGKTWKNNEVVMIDTTEDYRYPNIVSDPSGTLHVIVYEGTVSDKITHVTKGINDSSWSAKSDVATGVSETIEQMYAVPGSGQDIWLLQQNNFSTTGLKIYRWNGSSWSASTSPVGNHHSDSCDLMVDPSGNAHIIWSSSLSDLRYAYSNDTIPYTQYSILPSTSGITSFSTGPRATLTSNNKIHIIYPSGNTTGPIHYVNFDIPTSGSPTLQNLQLIADLNGGIGNNEDLATISSDTQNNIYVQYSRFFSSQNQIITLESSDYINFSASTGISTVAGGDSVNRLIAPISTIFPKINGLHVNMPKIGMYTNYLDSGESPDQLFIAYDSLTSWEYPQSQNDNILGFTNSIGFKTSDINGYISVITDFNNSSISGFSNAIGFITNPISGYINSVNGIDSIIKGYIPAVGFLSPSISGFINAIAKLETRDINGFVNGHELFISSISGTTIASILQTSTINGFIHGHQIANNTIFGNAFGISGIITSDIGGYTQSLIESDILGNAFGILGVNLSSINGFVNGHSVATSTIGGLVTAFDC